MEQPAYDAAQHALHLAFGELESPVGMEADVQVSDQAGDCDGYLTYIAQTIGRGVGVHPFRGSSIVRCNSRHPGRQRSLSCGLCSCCQHKGNDQ